MGADVGRFVPRLSFVLAWTFVIVLLPCTCVTANIFGNNDYELLHGVGQRADRLSKEIFQVYDALGHQQEFKGTDCLDHLMRELQYVVDAFDGLTLLVSLSSLM